MPGKFQFDIVVVGAGPAGLAAACTAAESGQRVGLIDDTPWLGGQIWRGEQTSVENPQARRWIERVRNCGATLLDQTAVIASPNPGVLLAEHPEGPRTIQWNQLILATGARELLLPFPGWTLPGVFGVGGLQALVKNGWPIANKRVVIAGSGPLLWAVADGLRKRGAQIVAIAEQAEFSKVLSFGKALFHHPAKLFQGFGLKLRLVDVAEHYGTWVSKAEGDDCVRAVTLTDSDRTWTEPCDVLACGFGLVPNTELPQAAGCELNNGFVAVDEFQMTNMPSVFCAGEPTGIGGADAASIEGQIAGCAAAGRRSAAETLFPARQRWHQFRGALARAFALRPELKSLANDATLFCRCEDVTFGRLRQFNGWRDAKLQSRCGMGPCQGRICGAAAQFVFGWKPESIRPPVLPARVGSLISEQTPAPATPAAAAKLAQ